jgi:ATP-dependent protease ClpP protease subunit
MEHTEPLLIDIIDPTGFGSGAFNAVYIQMKGQKGRPIKAVVNEYGGNALEGIGIHNLFLGHDARVEAHIPAFAISAHTIVSSGADHVTMPKNGYFMVHNPWSVAVGEAEDMQHSADLLDSLKKQIVDIYHRKTKLGKKRLSEMMDEETWLTPQEALSFGFVDELVEGATINNLLRPEQLAAFKNVPANFFEQNNSKPVEMNIFAEISAFFFGAKPATETDVKEVLSRHGNLETMRASIRTELETELNAAHKAEMEAIQSGLAETERQLAALQELTNQQADEIAELKKQPAATHTGGAKEEVTPENARHSEITRRIAAKMKTGTGLPKW